MSPRPPKCGHLIFIKTCESCLKIQSKWYAKIQKKGFEDIEDSKELLKRWSGSASYLENVEEEQVGWPEQKFSEEERLLNHPDFEEICEHLFKHGNNVINPKIMVEIWQLYCEGWSERKIEKKYHIHNSTIHKAIQKLKEFMKVMNLEDDKEKVVLRFFEPLKDSGLIFSSWRDQVWYAQFNDEDRDADGELPEPSKEFKVYIKKDINRILDLEKTEVRIACLQKNPDQIIGYGVLNDLTIEFVYVKTDYRSQRIGGLLTKGFKNVAEPMTKIGKAIVKSHSLRLKENKEDGRKEEATKVTLSTKS